MTRIDLDQLRIDSPCPKRWDDLEGDGPTRYCDHCSLHVHNLSSRSRRDAEALVAEKGAEGGRLCVAYTQRADGSVVHIRSLARRLVVRLGAAASFALGLLSFLGGCRQPAADPGPGELDIQVSDDDRQQLLGSPAPLTTTLGRVMVGEVVLQPPEDEGGVED